jgi:hypothetical protein
MYIRIALDMRIAPIKYNFVITGNHPSNIVHFDCSLKLGANSNASEVSTLSPAHRSRSLDFNSSEPLPPIRRGSQ